MTRRNRYLQSQGAPVRLLALNGGSDVMTIVTRRATLGFGLGLVLAKPSFLYAQSQSDYEQIGPHVRSSIDLLAFAIVAERSEDNAVEFVARDYHSRRRLIGKANELKLLRDKASADNFVLMIPKLGRPHFSDEYFNADTFKSQAASIEMISNAGVPIVPDMTSVQPIGIVSVPPLPKSQQSDALVLATIIFETLGVTFDEGALSALIKENPDFEKNLNEALQHTIKADWDKLARVSEKVFAAFVGSQLFKKMLEKGAKKLTFNLAVRCVPIVGWIYVAASFVISVKRNFYRFSFA